MKKFFSNLFGLAANNPWWVKITTSEPKCIYYFGPFDSEADAMAAKPGYVEDLQGEGAQQIQFILQKAAEPAELTIEMETPLASSVMMTA